MKKITLLAGLIVSGAVLSSCDAACTTNLDCSGGRVCIAGECTSGGTGGGSSSFSSQISSSSSSSVPGCGMHGGICGGSCPSPDERCEALGTISCGCVLQPSCGTMTPGGSCRENGYCPNNGRCDMQSCSCIPGCQTDNDCPDQVCDVGSGQCVDCVTNGNCPVEAQFCNELHNVCQECRNPSDCPADPLTGISACVIGECVQCMGDSDCPNSARFCGPGNTCEECFNDSHCAAGERCSPGGSCIPR